VDIHQPSINWCRQKIGARHSNFQFTRIDVRNQAYNPKGTQLAETYRLPFADSSFDLILVKSVFTHMRPAEVENYVSEVARMMKMTGRCLATFFLLNAEQERLARNGANTLVFKYGEGVWRYVYEQSPESAVAYDESFVMQLLAKHGLQLKELFYGIGPEGKTGYLIRTFCSSRKLILVHHERHTAQLASLSQLQSLRSDLWHRDHSPA
jgi:SAM-dependent methyltransferase